MSSNGQGWSWMRRQWLGGTRPAGGGGAPPVSVNWGGPQVGMNPGAWTAEVESPAVEFVAPSFDATVNVVISDGAGGFYVGGAFTSVTDSVATYTTGYARLVRLTPAGLVDTAFSCPMGNAVSALALDSTGLYVGGFMSTANAFGGATRLRCGRVRPFNHATPGAVDAWRPDFGGGVLALLLDGDGKLYVGGQFTATGGTDADYTSRTRNHLARITTGAAATCDDWRPDFNSIVWSIFLGDAGKLYVGGQFTATGGAGADYATATRNLIAAVNDGASAAPLAAWDPNANGVVGGFRQLTPTRVLVWGSFTTIANHLISGGTRMAVLEAA